MTDRRSKKNLLTNRCRFLIPSTVILPFSIEANGILKYLAIEGARCLKDPAPAFVVSELADSAVNFTVRLWVSTTGYWGVYFDIREKVKKVI